MSLSARRFQLVERVRRWRGCRSKMRYESLHEAERARERCEDARDRPLRVYDCAACGGWHLSSKPFRR